MREVLVELDATNADADGASVQEQLQAAISEQLRTESLAAALRGRAEGAPRLKTTAPLGEGWGEGQPRRTLATAQLLAEWQDVSAKLARFGAELARRQAEMTTVRELIGKLEATLPIAQQREADIRNLTQQGFMSGHAGQDRTRERIELERDLATQRARLVEAQAALRETEQSRVAYVAETQRSLRIYWYGNRWSPCFGLTPFLRI